MEFRSYSTFTPQVVRMLPPRPITTDDLERDRVLEQRIALFKWIEPHHLDIPDGHGRDGFLMFAQQGQASNSSSREDRSVLKMNTQSY